jgi:hypothetical protein
MAEIKRTHIIESSPLIKRIEQELFDPYRMFRVQQRFEDQKYMSVINGIVVIRSMNGDEVLHEIAHMLCRPPELWYRFNRAVVRYGFRLPTTFGGLIRMIQNELQAGALTRVLIEHLSGRPIDPVRCEDGWIDLCVSHAQRRFNCGAEYLTETDLVSFHEQFRGWLQPAETILERWHAFAARLVILSDKARDREVEERRRRWQIDNVDGAGADVAP